MENPQHSSLMHMIPDLSYFESMSNTTSCQHPIPCDQITTMRVSPTDFGNKKLPVAMVNFIGRNLLVPCGVHSDPTYECKQFELTNIPVPCPGLSHQHSNIDLSESTFEELNEDRNHGSTLPRSNDHDSLPSNLEEYLESLDDCDISLPCSKKIRY